MNKNKAIDQLIKQHGITVYLSDVQRVSGAKMVTVISSDYKIFESMLARNRRQINAIANKAVSRVVDMIGRGMQ